MEPLVTGCYFEDLTVGKKFCTIGRTITEADMIAFCNCTGMNSELFTNVEYQKARGVMKGRPVPGIFAYCLCEGFGAHGINQGTVLALLNLEVNFERTIVIGDTIHCEQEVIEARPSKSHNDRGLVRLRQHIVKQDGTIAITYTALRLFRRREKAA